MLIPLVFAYFVASIVLMIICVSKQSKTALVLLNVFWWLMAALSAVFTIWAWNERAYSENWAFMGFFFFSLPTILITVFLAISFIAVGRVKRSATIRKAEVSFYLLLLFLIMQAVMGYFAGR